jgi:hypothetical protein
MAFPNITDFKEQLLDGGARPSLFEMTIDYPVGLIGSGVVPAILPAQLKNRFHCRLTEIPGSQINPITVKFAGREIKYAGQRVFSNISITIINDEAFTVRRGLEMWLESMNTREQNVTNYLSPTSEGYAGTGVIRQYSKTGSVLRSYRLVDLFPVTLSPIALDWSNDAAIEEYTCEFAYQYWEPSAPGTSS